MADFTLNGPGTTNNPWTPANIVIPVGSIQSDATGWRSTGFVYTAFAHNATYGSTIISTTTVAVAHAADQVYPGAVVRSGANAGAHIGIRFDINGDAIIQTTTPAGVATNVSTQLTGVTVANGDVLTCTVAISGGTATITGAINGTPLSFTGGNTTTTYASEPSLAAGGVMDPQNTNGTKLSQFTGTGVSASTVQAMALGVAGPGVSPKGMLQFRGFPYSRDFIAPILPVVLGTQGYVAQPGPGVGPFSNNQFKAFPFSNFIAPPAPLNPVIGSLGRITPPGPGVGPMRRMQFQSPRLSQVTDSGGSSISGVIIGGTFDVLTPMPGLMI